MLAATICFGTAINGISDVVPASMLLQIMLLKIKFTAADSGYVAPIHILFGIKHTFLGLSITFDVGTRTQSSQHYTDRAPSGPGIDH